MDPSYNNSFGSGTGASSGGGVGAGFDSGTGAGPVDVSADASGNVGTGGVVGGMDVTSNGVIASSSAGGNAVVGNGIGSGAGMQQPISSGTGDIILNGGQKAGGKKWRVVLVILAMVAVIGVAVGMIVMSLGRKDAATGGDVQSLFNIYANYFVNGEVSTDDVAIDDDEAAGDDSAVYFDRMVGEGDEAKTKEYMNNLQGYFDSFYNKYMQSVGEGDDASFISEYGNGLKLLTRYYGDGSLTRDAILGAYIDGGEAKANALISQAVSAYDGLVDVYGANFGELMQGFGQQELALIQQYDMAGCIVDADIDYICASERMAPEAKAISKMAAGYGSEVFDIVSYSSNVVHDDMAILADEIYKEETSEE